MFGVGVGGIDGIRDGEEVEDEQDEEEDEVRKPARMRTVASAGVSAVEEKERLMVADVGLAWRADK